MRILTAVLVAAFCLGGRTRADDFTTTTATVGRTGDNLVTPMNQLVTPAGLQVRLPNMRPQALALSPNGKRLVTAGLTHELVVLDPATGQIVQRVTFPPDKTAAQEPDLEAILSPNKQAQLSFTGLTFAPDGSRIYMANVEGDIKVFGVDGANTVSALVNLRARFEKCGKTRKPAQKHAKPTTYVDLAPDWLFLEEIGWKCRIGIALRTFSRSVKRGLTGL